MYVALLRGINVGGNNKLPMKDLSRMFVEAGCERVQTYIQSGNVLFEATPDLVADLSDSIVNRISQDFGFRSPVILRTSQQLREVVANNPFLANGLSEDTLHVMFAANPPSPALITSLDPARCPPDAFMVQGQEVYLHLPSGVARTKLTNAYFDSKLRTITTQRNWRTVNTLLSLMESK